ncbi:MAG: nucleoside-triphosphatase [Anaerolineae bacterium]
MTGSGTEPARPLVVVTGEPRSGKTALCMAVAARLRRCHLQPGGVVCPGRFLGGRQIGKWVTDASTGQSRLLAERPWQGDVPGPYRLRPEALAWGNEVVSAAAGWADAVIIDEVGPEELLRGGGWVAGLVRAAAGDAPLLVVVRPSLLDDLLTKLAAHRRVDEQAGCKIVYANAVCSEMVARHLGAKHE